MFEVWLGKNSCLRGPSRGSSQSRGRSKDKKKDKKDKKDKEKKDKGEKKEKKEKKGKICNVFALLFFGFEGARFRKCRSIWPKHELCKTELRVLSHVNAVPIFLTVHISVH